MSCECGETKCYCTGSCSCKNYLCECRLCFKILTDGNSTMKNDSLVLIKASENSRQVLQVLENVIQKVVKERKVFGNALPEEKNLQLTMRNVQVSDKACDKASKITERMPEHAETVLRSENLKPVSAGILQISGNLEDHLPVVENLPQLINQTKEVKNLLEFKNKHGSENVKEVFEFEDILKMSKNTDNVLEVKKIQVYKNVEKQFQLEKMLKVQDAVEIARDIKHKLIEKEDLSRLLKNEQVSPEVVRDVEQAYGNIELESKYIYNELQHDGVQQLPQNINKAASEKFQNLLLEDKRPETVNMELENVTQTSENLKQTFINILQSSNSKNGQTHENVQNIHKLDFVQESKNVQQTSGIKNLLENFKKGQQRQEFGNIWQPHWELKRLLNVEQMLQSDNNKCELELENEYENREVFHRDDNQYIFELDNVQRKVFESNPWAHELDNSQLVFELENDQPKLELGFNQSHGSEIAQQLQNETINWTYNGVLYRSIFSRELDKFLSHTILRRDIHRSRFLKHEIMKRKLPRSCTSTTRNFEEKFKNEQQIINMKDEGKISNIMKQSINLKKEQASDNTRQASDNTRQASNFKQVDTTAKNILMKPFIKQQLKDAQRLQQEQEQPVLELGKEQPVLELGKEQPVPELGKEEEQLKFENLAASASAKRTQEVLYSSNFSRKFNRGVMHEILRQGLPRSRFLRNIEIKNKIPRSYTYCPFYSSFGKTANMKLWCRLWNENRNVHNRLEYQNSFGFLTQTSETRKRMRSNESIGYSPIKKGKMQHPDSGQDFDFPSTSTFPFPTTFDSSPSNSINISSVTGFSKFSTVPIESPDDQDTTVFNQSDALLGKHFSNMEKSSASNSVVKSSITGSSNSSVIPLESQDDQDTATFFEGGTGFRLIEKNSLSSNSIIVSSGSSNSSDVPFESPSNRDMTTSTQINTFVAKGIIDWSDFEDQ